MYDVYTLTYYYNIYIIVGYNTTNGEIECHYMYTTTDYTQYFNALILQCKLMFRNDSEPIMWIKEPSCLLNYQ